MKLEEGMYLKCTLQNNSGALLDAAVRIDSIKNRELVVLGFERSNGNSIIARRFRIENENISRVQLKVGSDVWIDGQAGKIIAYSNKRTTKNHFVYWCKMNNKIIVVSEERIQACFDDYEKSADELFLTECNGSVDDFVSRYEINCYLNKINSITSGYKDAIDKKINLYAHQVETVQKVLSNRPYRAILADEVGLGKTIEAFVILDFMMKKSVCKTALIVVPDQLIYQWKNEAKEKFGLDVSVFSYSSYIKGREKNPIMLIGFSNLVRYGDEFVLSKEWGLVIIDEVHKVLREGKIYAKLFKLCAKVSNHLLLSATPIMKRNTEYYKLLKLLHPAIYAHIGAADFAEIMKKKEIIEGEVANLASDIHYAFDDEVLGEYVDRLKSIAENIADFVLKDYLENIKDCTCDEKRKCIKRAILYLQKAYEIESKFIRHRRSDILDESSKRVLNNDIGFYLKGEDKLSGEEALYQCFTEEIQEVHSHSEIEADKIISIVNAFFSSASALNRELIDSNLYKIFPKTSRKAYFESVQEKKTLSNSRIEELVYNLKKYDGDEKIVIFSDLSESVKLIFDRLQKEFGDRNVILFTSADSEARMQIAVNNFVNNNIKIMVCDKQGAEGRNFQFADVIIHYDLPWSPARLEQRIGRLDRIGRKPGKKVYNDVLYVRDSIEEDLFSLYNNCLDIFNESLCGIEIIFDDLWDAIKSTISERGLFGFSYVYDLVNDLKEKCSQCLFEEMLDLECLEDDMNTNNTAKKIIELFTNAEKKKFYEAVFRWHYDSGYGTYVAKEIEDHYYQIPCAKRNEKIDARRKYELSMTGNLHATYDLEKFTYYDETELLSLEHPLVDSIIKSVQKTNTGKVIAVKVDDASDDWTGFVITWKPRFWELDNMGKLWSNVNVSIKNDYINKTRISIPYTIKNGSYLSEDIIEMVKTGSTKSLSLQEVSEILDYADVSIYLQKAIESTKEDYIEILKSEIDYERLDKKIELLSDENDVNQMVRRTKSTSQFLEIHKSIRKMLTKFGVEIESIMFVSMNKR